MKLLTRLPALLLAIGMLASAAVPATRAQDDSASPTVAQIVVAISNDEDEPQFTILREALEVTQLIELLDTRGPFTVFAPTDAAFERYLSTNGFTRDDLVANPGALRQILLYHILPGAFSNEDLPSIADGSIINMLPQATLEVNLDAGGLYIDQARILATDIEASNGVIHVIDSVLYPGNDVFSGRPEVANGRNTVTTFLVSVAKQSPPEFMVLVEAAIAADLLPALDNPDARYTVFAPTDTAFAAFLDENGISAEDLLNDTESLRLVLSYHVVPTVILAEDFIALDNGYIGTLLAGAPLAFRVDGAVFINDASVVAPDIELSNGVVHVIDRVLIP